jgi:hypothetical protein
MDFKVLIAESAIADLKEIVEFVAEDNREAALRLGEKLLVHGSNRTHLIAAWAPTKSKSFPLATAASFTPPKSRRISESCSTLRAIQL